MKKWKKKKKCWRYHHFTHVYQKPQLYEIQFLRCRVRHNVFVVLGRFLPSPPPLPPSNPENQIFEKMKKVLDMSSFFIFATKHTIIWCMLTQIWSATDIFFHHFRSFFTLLPHYWHQKWKFGKNIKKYPEISRYHHLTQVSQKSWSYALLFLRYGAWWM